MLIHNTKNQEEKNITPQNMSVYVVLLAAGFGTRMQSSIPKQFLLYKNAPLWWESVQKFNACPTIQGIVIVFPHEEELFQDSCKKAKELHEQNNIGIPFFFAKGGDERYHSVYNGLMALPKECTHVLIHDSARPFFTNTLVQNLCNTFYEKNIKAVIPALSVTDTIKKINTENNLVEESPNRATLRAIQTPQAFETKALIEAHNKINTLSQKLPITDDAMMIEFVGEKVFCIDGEEDNIKITTAKDMDMLASPIKQIPCSGFGYDVHRFGGNRPFKLGGISIPTDLQIEAHSDGDVLLHALIDALLSCLSIGDIGTLFPDTDEKFNNISSSLLLNHVMDLWQKSSLTLCHVDLTVITQKPKISPFTKEITKNIARLLSINVNQVNTKATTEEKLGFTGELKGIKAVALVSALKTVE